MDATRAQGSHTELGHSFTEWGEGVREIVVSAAPPPNAGILAGCTGVRQHVIKVPLPLPARIPSQEAF